MSEKEPEGAPEQQWDERPNPDTIQQLAGLVAMTNAELNQIDEAIIDGSNLKAKDPTWNPQAIVQREVQAAEQAGTLKSRPPGSSVPPAGMHPSAQPPPPPQPVQHVQQVYPENMNNMPFVTDPQVIERLDKIEAALTKLQVTYDGIMKNMLKNKTKQITIRFDDTKTTK